MRQDENTREMAEASGVVTVEKVRGRSTITRCFFRYPLKLILPKKVKPFFLELDPTSSEMSPDFPDCNVGGRLSG